MSGSSPNTGSRDDDGPGRMDPRPFATSTIASGCGRYRAAIGHAPSRLRRHRSSRPSTRRSPPASMTGRSRAHSRRRGDDRAVSDLDTSWTFTARGPRDRGGADSAETHPYTRAARGETGGAFHRKDMAMPNPAPKVARPLFRSVSHLVAPITEPPARVDRDGHAVYLIQSPWYPCVICSRARDLVRIPSKAVSGVCATCLGGGQSLLNFRKEA